MDVTMTKADWNKDLDAAPREVPLLLWPEYPLANGRVRTNLDIGWRAGDGGFCDCRDYEDLPRVVAWMLAPEGPSP